MDRSVLSKATNLDEAPIPNYIVQQISQCVGESSKDAEKIADFLLLRMQKSNPTIKQKALLLLLSGLKTGNGVFRDILKEEMSDFQKLAIDASNYNGPESEKWREVRYLAEDIVEELNTNIHMSRASSSAPRFGASGHCSNNPSMKQYDNPNTMNPPLPTSSYGRNNFNNKPPISYGGKTYTDNPPRSSFNSRSCNNNPSYGCSSNFNDNPPSSYGNSNNYNNNNVNGYNNNSGPASTSHAPGSLSGGVWGQSGYSTNSNATGGGGMGKTSNPRDNRPTVLVGQNGRPNAMNTMMGGRGHMANTMSGISTSSSSNWREKMSMKFSSNRSSSNVNSINLNSSNSQPNKLSQKLDELKKIGHEAKDRWDRRNMDKSMGDSLAAHDDYVNTHMNTSASSSLPYHHQPVSNNCDTSGEYETSLVASVCGGTSTAGRGINKLPDHDSLKRFLELASTLQEELIANALLANLENEAGSSANCRFKTYHVIESLLEAPGCSQYGHYFEQETPLIEMLYEALKTERKTSAKQKVQNLLLLLGEENVTYTKQQQPPSRNHAHSSQINSNNNLLDFSDLSLAESVNTSTNNNVTIDTTPIETRSRTLSDFGKDLFAQANNSPRAATQTTTGDQSQQSAFSFI